MKQIVFLMTLVFLTAPAVLADVAPPSGYKNVSVTIEIETEKDYPDYNFYLVSGCGRKIASVGEIKISKEKMTTFAWPGGGCERVARLVAVSKKSGVVVKEDEQLALPGKEGNKIPGVLVSQTYFYSITQVPSGSDNSVTQRYRLEALDDEKGLVLSPIKSPEMKTAGSLTKFSWIGGGFLLLAVIGTGVWGFRRLRP